jgi:hypothetical protein
MATRVARSRANVYGQATVVPLAARTSNGNSGTLQGFHAGALAHAAAPQCRLTITAASGTTPTLDVVVQDSPDGITWTTRDTFPQQTAQGTVTRALPGTLVAFQRVSWTIAGTTPSFTFSVQFASSAGILQ